MRAASLFLLLTLAACAGGPDGEQEWLCRRIAPALFDGEKKLTVLSSTAGRSRDVFVRLSVEASPGTHVVYCRFAGSGFSPRKRELVAVSVDGQAMSEAGVHFLREGWLQAQESITAAPPRARPEGEATLGAGTAYALQQALSALPKTGIIVLLCAAYALLYGLTGRINLAFGGFVALGGMAMTIGAAAMDIAGAPGILAPLAFGLACAVTLSALHGLVTAGLLFVPLAARPGQHILIASVGLMIALEEFLRLAQGAGTRWLAPVLNLPVTVARAPTYDVTVTPVALATAGTAAVAAIALLVYQIGRAHV